MSSSKKENNTAKKNQDGLLLVESPSKAKTIDKYLNGKFKVLATFGHVRDIPSKSGSVLPEEDFFMNYQPNPNSKKHLEAISEALQNLIKNHDSSGEKTKLFIATDPDREGEAIAWHVLEALKQNKKIDFKKISVHRSVFNEITKDAVSKAIANPREIDLNLVDSQQARRALDYLVGFTISPILWKTVGGLGASAGRVQSVGLRLLCEREKEIFNFCPQQYWTLHGFFQNPKKKKSDLEAELIQFKGEKLERFSIPNENEAKKIHEEILEDKSFKIKEIQTKDQQRSPFPPFSTSSLQQDASSKLGFSSKKTMSVAQKLYEGVNINGENLGLITYMRTDGVYVSDAAIKDARAEIGNRFGKEFLPNLPREFKNKNKNAQEAHEAIRPTMMNFFPDESLKKFLSEDEFKLYSLIYKRMIASQMSAAVYGICNVFISSLNEQNIFKSSFSSLKFPGYTSVYNEESKDDKDIETKKHNIDLSSLKEGEILEILKIDQKQHFTSPPPRFGEASLIKKMEEIGIGRPSTYASIISVLQDREYAVIEKKRFYVTTRGRVISDFLVSFFEKYVAYDFTAKMEDDLDRIASGEIFWKNLLKNFWENFESRAKEVSSIKTSEIIEKVSSDMARYIFSQGGGAEPLDCNKESEEQKEINDSCPKCFQTLHGKLKVKFSKYGYFLGCEKYPECDFIRPLPLIFFKNSENVSLDDKQNFMGDLSAEIPIFEDEEVRVFEKNGRFGKYLEVVNKKTEEKKNVGFPEAFLKVWQGSREELIKNLSRLPLKIGLDPESGEEINLGLGKFGFYVFSENMGLASVKSFNPFEIKLQAAIELLKQNLEKQKKNSKEIDFGPDLGIIRIVRGGFGKMYIALTRSNFKFDDAEEIEVPKEKQKIIALKGLIDFNEPNIDEIREFAKKAILKFKKTKKRVVKKK